MAKGGVRARVHRLMAQRGVERMHERKATARDSGLHQVLQQAVAMRVLARGRVICANQSSVRNEQR